MYIIRKIKLNKLGCYQIKDNEKELFDFVENNLLGLKKSMINDYIKLSINDKALFYLYKYNNHLTIKKIVWDTLNNLGYNDKQKELIIKSVLKDVYEFNNVIIDFYSIDYSS